MSRCLRFSKAFSALSVIALVAMLFFSSVPLSAASPSYSYQTLAGTTAPSGSYPWNVESFSAGNGQYSCFVYLANNFYSNDTLRINVLNSTGNWIANLTYELNVSACSGGSGNQYGAMGFTIYQPNATGAYILAAVASVYGAWGFAQEDVIGLNCLLLWCDGVNLTLISAQDYGQVGVGYTGVYNSRPQDCFAYVTNSVNNTDGSILAGVYIAGEGNDGTIYPATYGYWICEGIASFNSNHYGAIKSSTTYTGTPDDAYPYIFRTSDATIYWMSAGAISSYDEIHDIVTPFMSTSCSGWMYYPLYHYPGAVSISNLSYDPSSGLIASAYFQSYYPVTANSTDSMEVVSSFYNGTDNTQTNSYFIANGCPYAAYALDWQDGSPWAVLENKTASPHQWDLVQFTLDDVGHMIQQNVSSIGSVEAYLQTAYSVRWCYVWQDTNALGYTQPGWALGTWSTTDGDGNYQQELVKLGTTVAPSFPPSFITSTTYSNYTYTANSNLTQFFDRTVTESYSAQFLTAGFIYLANVNASINVGMYRTPDSSTTSYTLLASQSIGAGYNGWVGFSSINYSQPYGSHVSFLVLPSNLSDGASYTVGTPSPPVSCDVYNYTALVSGLPSTVSNSSIAAYQYAQNLAAIYQLSVPGGGSGGAVFSNGTWILYQITENMTIPTINIPVVQNASVAVSYGAVTSSMFGWIGYGLQNVMAPTGISGTSLWGAYAGIAIPLLLIMLASGRWNVPIVGIIGVAIAAAENAAVGYTLFSAGILSLIAFVCLIALFSERSSGYGQ